MPDEVDVANMALGFLKVQKITSLTQKVKNSNAVQAIFDLVRDDLLYSHPWGFATRWVKLARLSNVPEAEFDYTYSVPTDWLRTVRICDNDAGRGTAEFREGYIDDKTVIMSSASELWMEAILLVTDVNRWSPGFRRLMAESLARDLAKDLANSTTLYDKYEKSARRKLAQARSINSMGQKPRQLPRGTWADARGGHRTRGTIQGESG